MFRIDAEGHVLNQFTDGNPQTGQQATIVSAEFLNAQMEEIAHVVEFSGLALNKLDSTQLRQAVIALIAGVVGSGGGAVPTTRQVLGGGLVTGGGPLAADLTLSVAKALAADVLTGTLDTAAITPLQLKTAFAPGAGFWKLPGGGIIQRGQIIGGYTEGSVLVTLPTTFADSNYTVVGWAVNQAASLTYDLWAQRVSKTASNFTAYFQDSGTNVNFINGLEWIAIGA